MVDRVQAHGADDDHHGGKHGIVAAATTGPRGGFGANGKPSYTVDEAAQQITRNGYGWNAPGVLGTAVTISYSFRSTAPGTMPEDTGIFSRFNATQIAQAELALAAWSDVAGITFVRVRDAGTGYSNNGEICLANYGSGAEDSAGFCFLPNGSELSGDLWINATLDYNLSPRLGNYGRSTLVHELGHALGLEHPGDYDAGNGTPTYADDAPYFEDSTQYSIMSYWSERETGGFFGSASSAAPMLDDIAALQRLYGANMTTRTGNTVYGFNSTAGREWLSTTVDRPIIGAIWDAGGIDTLDFSQYGMSQLIDLGEGRFSDIGGLSDNVAIAVGAVIENATGGTGADRIVGNAAANVLRGGGGADVIEGGAGNDRLIAGSGGGPIVRVAYEQDRGTLPTAISIDGAFSVRAAPGIDAAETTPHTTIVAESNGTVEYYQLTAAKGATITLDIDGASFDSYVYLYDASGNELASSDDGTGDSGSVPYQFSDGVGTLDSYLTFTVNRTGTYYIAVRGYVDADFVNNTPQHGAYQLNVSVTGHATVGTLQGATLDGGANDDILVSGTGDDRLSGGDGIDTASYEAAKVGVTVGLLSTALQNTIGAGNDILSGIENLYGSSFDDFLSGNASVNTLIGGDGRDMLSGGNGDDILSGGNDNDILFGGGGADRVDGGLGYDTTAYNNAGSGVVVDLAITAAQNTAGGGIDTLIGIEAAYGSVHDDRLYGNSGNNRMRGNSGADLIDGRSGADNVNGELGLDRLTGGAGADTFSFSTTLGASNVDTITDFTVSDDTVELWRTTFTGLTVGGLAAGAFYTGAGAHDGDDRIIYNAATGALSFDADGTGGAAAVQFATITRGLALTNADFVVI